MSGMAGPCFTSSSGQSLLIITCSSMHLASALAVISMAGGFLGGGQRPSRPATTNP